MYLPTEVYFITPNYQFSHDYRIRSVCLQTNVSDCVYCIGNRFQAQVPSARCELQVTTAASQLVTSEHATKPSAAEEVVPRNSVQYGRRTVCRQEDMEGVTENK